MNGDPASHGIDLGAVPFVGRERELALLRSAREAAHAGSGRLVLLGGEPGIGKTRLAAVVAAEAAQRGMVVWSARCWEDGAAPPFWPWNAALRRWIEDGGDAAAVRAAGPFAVELTRVFAVLGERMPALPAAAEWESDQARFRLFDTVARFVAEVARPTGLVVVLDDVHWADGSSRRLLEFLAADLARTRLLIISTYRDREVERAHPFFATLASLAREPATRRVLLSGLSAPECVRYVTLAGGDDDGLGNELHRETNGNPFFLGELVRFLASEGRLGSPREPRRVPPGVREVVARRLERLGDACRTALAVGALLGDTFDCERLAAVLGSAPHDEPTVADGIDRAVRDRVLVEHGGGYAFAHALIRRVVLDEIAPSRRAAWHGRIAAAIERVAGAHPEAVAGELVRHYLGTSTAAGLEKAFMHARSGAEHAARNLGFEESARLYAIALDVGTRTALLDDVDTIELQLALAYALRRSGDVAAAREECREAAARARLVGRFDLLGRAALVAAGPVPDFYRIDPEGRAALEEACRAAEHIDDPLRARLQARLASDIIAANEVDQFDRAAVLGDEAASAARRSGDGGALARALFAGFYLAALGTRPRTSGAHVIVPPTLPSLQELLDAAEEAGDLEFAAELRHTRTVAMFALGEADAYQAEHDALAAMAAASRVPEALWLADAIGAMRATVEGRFAEGRRLSEQALATGARMQLPNAAGVHLGQQVMWHAARGRLADLLPMLEDFVERHPRILAWRAFRALARLAAGDAVGARSEYRILLAAGLTPAKRGVNLRSYLAGLGALCVGLRDHELAPRLYDMVARRPEPWAVDGCMSLGPWALLSGSLARLCGRRADAAAHFEQAIDLGERMRSRPVVAQAQSLLAAVQLSGDPDAAIRMSADAMLSEAERTAHELDLTDVRTRVERLRATLPHPPVLEPNVLRREGDFWVVRFGGTALRVKDARGLHYLAALLTTPRRELHVLQLAGVGRSAPAAAGTEENLPVDAFGVPLADTSDARARSAYAVRLDEVRTGLDEAERFGDLGRAELLRTELDQLMTQLAARFRSRAHVQAPAEAARKAVTKALRTQIGRLLAKHPILGRHLRHSVRMGTVCVYAPTDQVDWDT